MESIERINKVFRDASFNKHPLATGVGSKGGHIARELKSPGPLNGHIPISPKDRLTFFHGYTPKPKKKEYHLLELPVWNDRFTTQKTLSVDPFQRSAKPLGHTANVKRDIQTYLSMSKSLYSMDDSESTTNHKPSVTHKITQKTMNSYYNDPNNSLFNDNVFPDESDEEVEVQAYPSTMVRSAEKLWKRMVVELKCEAMRIHYVDLVEIAKLQAPSAVIVNIIGYLCILLGVQPTWEAAKRYLFKECVPLLKFLHEVCVL